MTKKIVSWIIGVALVVALFYLIWGNSDSPSTTPSLTTATTTDVVASPSATTTSNLGVGSTGTEVVALQQMLIDKGYLTIVSSPTGYFGPYTKAALAEYQAASGSTPTSSSTTSAATGQYKDGAYTGSVADATYGQLEVVVTISGGKITNTSCPIQPDAPGHTSQVSATALPQLRQEAIAAQSASIAIVSGATQDSQAFQQSLAVALSQAQN